MADEIIKIESNDIIIKQYTDVKTNEIVKIYQGMRVEFIDGKETKVFKTWEVREHLVVSEPEPEPEPEPDINDDPFMIKLEAIHADVKKLIEYYKL